MSITSDMSLAERAKIERENFRDALKRQHITYTAFSRAAGCSVATVSTYLSDTFKPHALPDYFYAAAERLGLEVAT